MELRSTFYTSWLREAEVYRVSGFATSVKRRFSLAECRIRSEPFVEEMRGGRTRSPGDQGGMG